MAATGCRTRRKHQKERDYGGKRSELDKERTQYRYWAAADRSNAHDSRISHCRDVPESPKHIGVCRSIEYVPQYFNVQLCRHICNDLRICSGPFQHQTVQNYWVMAAMFFLRCGDMRHTVFVRTVSIYGEITVLLFSDIRRKMVVYNRIFRDIAVHSND